MASRGYVVQDKETGMRFALSEHNITDQVEVVRPLKPGESTRTYVPRSAPRRSAPAAVPPETDVQVLVDQSPSQGNEEGEK